MVTNGDDTGDGKDLTTLDGTSWTLVEGTGVTTPNDVSLTLQLEDGRASGSGGFNRFTSSYEEEGNSISFGPVASTRMACPDEIMSAERAYFAALGSAAWWSASGNELVLSNSSGEELLRYEATST